MDSLVICHRRGAVIIATGLAAFIPLTLGMCERVQLNEELSGFFGRCAAYFALVPVHFTLLQRYGILPLSLFPVLWPSVDSRRQ